MRVVVGASQGVHSTGAIPDPPRKSSWFILETRHACLLAARRRDPEETSTDAATFMLLPNKRGNDESSIDGTVATRLSCGLDVIDFKERMAKACKGFAYKICMVLRSSMHHVLDAAWPGINI